MDNKNQTLLNHIFIVNKNPEATKALYRKEYMSAISRFESEGGHIIGLQSNKEKDRKAPEPAEEEWFAGVPFLKGNQ